MRKSLLCTSAILLSGIAPLLVGCRSTAGAQMAPVVDGSAAATDPTVANFATPYTGIPSAAQTKPSLVSYAAVAQNTGAPQTSGQYQQPVGNSQQNEAYRYNTQQPQGANSGQYTDPANLQNGAISEDEYNDYADLLDPNVPAASQPPPPLPTDYEQPEAPGDDYLWTPGYWDYANTGYYYVPGAWVGAPYAGALWTPGWWGYQGSGYRWHHGYWGQHVGYYGGVNYGFGFIGYGYQGGYWNNSHFFYNTAVNRVGSRISNSYRYDRRITVANNTYLNNSHTSYFGGPGGLRRGPAPQEIAARREQRTAPMQAQIANRQAAQGNRQQFFNTNGSRPQTLVSNRALQPDRNIVAPQRSQPGNGGFNNGQNGRPSFGNVNGGNPNSNAQQQRQLFDQQRQQERNQVLQQRDTDLQQRDGNLQLRQQGEQQRQQFDQQRQQQLNTQQQRQQLDQQRQQQQLNTQQQRQQLNQQQQRQQQSDTQRQQADAARQQLQQRSADNQQRQQQFQQQRQQMDVQRQQQNQQREQQATQQRQQMTQQREQMVQQRQAQAPRIEAPRAAPSMPRMEAPHNEAPHAGGGGDGGHHH